MFPRAATTPHVLGRGRVARQEEKGPFVLLRGNFGHVLPAASPWGPFPPVSSERAQLGEAGTDPSSISARVKPRGHRGATRELIKSQG